MPDIPPAPKRVLIIEDDEMLRQLYIDILAQAGFTVDSAADGAEGFTKIQSGGYDLILLDIMLPHMDGLTILGKLKTTPPVTPNKAIVVLSNLGQDTAISQAVSLGARGYMIKSDYTPDQVIAEVRRYLDTT